MNAFWEIIASNALITTFLGLMALVLGRLWRNPAALHLLWVVVLVKMAIPPLIHLHLPLGRLVVLAAPAENPALPALAILPDQEPTTATSATRQRSSQKLREVLTETVVGDPTQASMGWIWSSLPVLVWIGGTCGFGLVQARRIRRFALASRDDQVAKPDIQAMADDLAARLKLRRVPVVWLTARQVPPLVWSPGLAPRLIVPAAFFATQSRSAQRTILAHELAHIRRGDHRIRLVELAVTTLFWWHPVVWLASRQLRELEEICCDGQVLRLLPESPRIYAAALVDTLEFLAGRAGSTVNPLRTAIGSTASLTQRITMLTQTRTHRLTARTTLVVAGLCVVPLALAVAVESEPTTPGSLPMQNATTAPVAVLRGSVTDEAGTPLPDVRVQVAVPAVDLRGVDPTPHQLLEVRTDARGEYRLELPALTGPTTVALDALKPGYRRLVGMLMRRGDATRVEVDRGKTAEAALMLKPARYYRGVVVDEQGKPVPGVEVAASARSGRGIGGVERTRTDSAGIFEIFNYPLEPLLVDKVEARGVIRFEDPHYLKVRRDDIDAIPPTQRQDLKIVLPTGRKVTGTVMDAAGKPVAGAIVEVIGTERKAALADLAGNFTLRGLESDARTLNARALGIKQKANLTLSPDGDLSGLEIRLQPMIFPADLKKYQVLGMELTDLTPAMKALYDLPRAGGALILNPGQNADRFQAGTLNEGFSFTMVGTQRINSVGEFVRQLLAEASPRPGNPVETTSVRVVYFFETPATVGNRTQMMRLSPADLKDLQVVAEQLRTDPR